MEQTVIPIVDISELATPVPRSPESEVVWCRLAKEVDEALFQTGFVYLKHSGISEETVSRAFVASDSFFQLDDVVKRQYAKTVDKASPGWDNFSGYTPPGAELEGDADYEHKESFDISGRKRIFPNAHVPNYKVTFLALERELKLLTLKMCQLLGKSLGLQNESHFVQCLRHLQDSHVPHTTTLRALFYPEVTAEVTRHQNPARCAAHTDYGFITFLLLQQDAVGLEVQTVSGEWISAHPIPNTILMNVADFLQLWSDDRYTATLHRVQLPKDDSRSRARKTIAYFVNPDDSIQVAALPTKFNAHTGTRRTEVWNTLEHMVARSRTAYSLEEQ